MTSRIAARSATAVSVAALTTAALVATALPAVAEQASHRDATGDVVLLGGEDGSVTPQPGWKPGDIERIDVTHGAHRVRVRLAFRDVARRTDDAYIYKIRTPQRRFWIDGFTDSSRPQGHFFLSTNRRKPPRCAGLRHRIDYTNEQVRVSVPRRCIGDPARVRVGAAVQTWIWTDDPDQDKSRLDDGYATGEVEGLPMGPWLRRW
jgi:hypothetical protein